MKKNLATREAYADITGMIRVMEKRLLTKQTMEQVIDAASVSDAIRILSQNTSVALEANDTSFHIEATLQKDLFDTFDSFTEQLPEPMVVDLVKEKYVFLNHKIEAKNKFLTNKEPLVDLGKTYPSLELPDHITDPQDIDLYMDKKMYESMYEQALAFQNEYILNYYQKSIDFYNLRIILRAKAMNKPLSRVQNYFLDKGLVDKHIYLDIFGHSWAMIKNKLFYPYFGEEVLRGLDAFESNRHLGMMEKELENLLIAHVQGARLIAFGPEIPFAYLLAKENEVAQIRLLITAKQNKISEEVIRERLRDAYA